MNGIKLTTIKDALCPRNLDPMLYVTGSRLLGHPLCVYFEYKCQIVTYKIYKPVNIPPEPFVRVLESETKVKH